MQAPSPFDQFTGRGLRVAVIDSGINPAHPHVAGVAGGVFIAAHGNSPVYLDNLGHGTAVAGAIREKAPDASIYAVKVFDRSLRTNADAIIRAIDWTIEQEMDVVNLSLGTVNPAHRGRFEDILARALDRNVIIVAAREMNEQDALPGCLSTVIGVGLDWECPRETYRCILAESTATFFASGYPRAIPGVSQERNLNGVSFAVANMTGFVARARQACPDGSLKEFENLLIEETRK
jgi:subtilisin family serine protease